MKNLLLITLFSIPFGVLSQSTLLNNTYPALTFTTLLQSPLKSATPGNFDGKTVVLEFWATWCSPCLANVKHLNELQSRFGQSITFISVTDEPEEKIKKFLQKRKLNGWIACDTSKKMHRAYNVQGLPRTVIINKKGIVVYDGRPEQLDTIVLAAIDNETYAPQEEKATNQVNLLGGWSGGDDPVFTANFSTVNHALIPYQHTIRNTVAPQSGGNGWREYENGGVGITIINAGLAEIFTLMLNLPSPVRVICPASMDASRFDIIFSRNKGYTLETARAEIIKSVCTTFGIQWRDTLVNTVAFVAEISNRQYIIQESTINWDDPATKSYCQLTGLLNRLEEGLGQVIERPAETDTLYIDTFEIAGELYTMPVAGLQNWLVQKGMQFKETTLPVKKVTVN